MDGNRGVRAEACHVTAALAAAVGRAIAPLLRALLPPLWLALHDGYGEGAAAARGALGAAFPAAAKQREAVLFCRAEVRGHGGRGKLACNLHLLAAKRWAARRLACLCPCLLLVAARRLHHSCIA